MKRYERSVWKTAKKVAKANRWTWLGHNLLTGRDQIAISPEEMAPAWMVFKAMKLDLPTLFGTFIHVGSEISFEPNTDYSDYSRLAERRIPSDPVAWEVLRKLTGKSVTFEHKGFAERYVETDIPYCLPKGAVSLLVEAGVDM